MSLLAINFDCFVCSLNILKMVLATSSLKSVRSSKTTKLTHMTMERPKMTKRRLPSRFANLSENNNNVPKHKPSSLSSQLTSNLTNNNNNNNNIDIFNDIKSTSRESIFEPRTSDGTFFD